MPEILQGVLLGLVEGLTEFIPVSSTGHMILIADKINFIGDRAQAFEVFVQLGAILAVVSLFWKRFVLLIPKDLTGDLNNQNGFEGISGLVKLGLGCAPVFILGFLCRKVIKQHLFFPVPVAVALIFGALLMVLVEKKKKAPDCLTLDHLSYRSAFLIGCCQCMALWPGMSRSGSMIIAGMFFGLSRSVAAEFAFIVACPVMFAAVLFDMLKSWRFLEISDLPLFAVGFLVAYLSAALAVRWLITAMRRWSLLPFAVYRIVLGLAVLALAKV